MESKGRGEVEEENREGEVLEPLVGEREEEALNSGDDNEFILGEVDEAVAADFL
jgi:hypothetical protein